MAQDYPALWAYTRELYQMPGIAGTVAIDEYKAHYYGSHTSLNPNGIIPIGPELDFSSEHGRDEAFPRSASVTALRGRDGEDSTAEVPSIGQELQG